LYKIDGRKHEQQVIILGPEVVENKRAGGDDHDPKQTPKARWNGKKRVGGTCLLDGSRQEQTYVLFLGDALSPLPAG